MYGLLAAASLIALVVLDVARKLSESQSILYSVAPLLICLAAAASAVVRGHWKTAPRSARFAIPVFGLMLAISGAVGVLRALPTSQVLAGALAQSGILGGMVLGYGAARSEHALACLRSVTTALLLVNVAVAVLQQFGYWETSIAESIEGVSSTRGVKGVGQFSYTTGLFRTPEVFAGFLSLAAVLVCVTARPMGVRGSLGTPALLLLCIGAGVLTARRSGFALQLGAIVPFLIMLRGRARLATALVAIIGAGGVALNDEVASEDVGVKAQHMAVPEGLSTRLDWALSLRDRDWNLLSWTGDGLGSHGFAVRAGGELAAYREEMMLLEHPVLHYSWFGDLLQLGPLGAFLHALGFLLILIAMVRTAQEATGPGRWSSVGFFLVSLVVYYFVSTAFMLSLSNGFMTGLALGTGLVAQLYGTKVYPRLDEGARRARAPSAETVT